VGEGGEKRARRIRSCFRHGRKWRPRIHLFSPVHICPLLPPQIPENGSDICHLHVLHREFIIPALYPFLAHKWHGSWTEGKLEGKGGKTFNADICVDEQMLLMDYPLPGEVRVKITQCGPSQVYLDMQTPVGPVMIVETVTPVAPMQLRVLHALYAGPFVPRVVAKAILKSTVVQFEKDVPVWGNKRFMPSASGGAQLVAADSSIRTYRSWIRRFWDADQGSISFEQAAKQHAIDAMGLPSDVTLAW
jgi:cholesterol 7-dehydrogenase